jgi:hypothetical protein
MNDYLPVKDFFTLDQFPGQDNNILPMITHILIIIWIPIVKKLRH